jgi:hypothetical protein
VNRAAALGLALTILAAACALTTEVPPPGTRMVEAQVTNTGAVPITLGVRSSAGMLRGAAQPASLAARATQNVRFFVPAGDDWWITVNDAGMFPGSDANVYIRQGCRLFMEVNPDGSGGIGCG